MSEPMLLFETDPRTGTPKLRALNGAAAFWSQKELSQLEDQLRPRYDSLVREGSGTLEFKGHALHVKKQDGDCSRQPTLELWRTVPTSPPPATAAAETPPGPAPTLAWGEGFLAEIDRLFASAEFDVILPVEKAMLRLVLDELKGLIEKQQAAESALLLLVSLLMTAEYLSRTQRPNEPQPYAYALSGIERVLSHTPLSAPTPWGPLPATPNAEPPPSWLGRFWKRVTGAS